MRLVYARDDWNKNHITKHGSNESDAKYVIEHSEPPFPREIGNDKLLVWGQTKTREYLEVVFAFKLPDDLEFTSLEFLDWISALDYQGTVAIYIIHAMPMKDKQMRQYLRIRKSV
jgi:hypothetical protein